jgi:hypothetical protein
MKFFGHRLQDKNLQRMCCSRSRGPVAAAAVVGPADGSSVYWIIAAFGLGPVSFIGIKSVEVTELT